MDALLGHWLPMGIPRGSLVERIRYGRELLMEITGRDFGYDAMQWHDHLWDTDDGGYRWARRSREKWARQVEAAINNLEWQEAVRSLLSSAKPPPG